MTDPVPATSDGRCDLVSCSTAPTRAFLTSSWRNGCTGRRIRLLLLPLKGSAQPEPIGADDGLLCIGAYRQDRLVCG